MKEKYRVVILFVTKRSPEVRRTFYVDTLEEVTSLRSSVTRYGGVVEAYGIVHVMSVLEICKEIGRVRIEHENA